MTTLLWHPQNGTGTSRYKSTVITVKLKWLNKARNRLMNPQLQTLKSWQRPIQAKILTRSCATTWWTRDKLPQSWLCFGLSDVSLHQHSGIFPTYSSLYFSFFCLPFFFSFKHLVAQETQWAQIQSNMHPLEVKCNSKSESSVPKMFTIIQLVQALLVFISLHFYLTKKIVHHKTIY